MPKRGEKVEEEGRPEDSAPPVNAPEKLGPNTEVPIPEGIEVEPGSKAIYDPVDDYPERPYEEAKMPE